MQPEPARSDLYSEVRFRIPLPIAIPFGALIIIGGAAFGFSRILLAVGEEIAVALALVASLNILGACAVIALRPRMSSASLMELAVVVFYPVLIGAVIAVVGIAEPADEAVPPPPHEDVVTNGLVLEARAVAFDRDHLTFPADEEVVLTFNNEDTVPHDVHIYETEADMAALQNALFAGQVIAGGESVQYTIPPLEAGEYFFQCDLHPGSMVGTLTVE